MRRVLLAKNLRVFFYMPKYGILLKGGALHPKAYGIRTVGKAKIGPGDWRLLVGLKEHWNSSSEKAKELKLSDFGTPDELREMAKSFRTALNREEATKILKEIAKKGELTSKSGVVAFLSGKSAGKIVSGQAIQQSFDQKAHWQATANVDKLFQNAIEPWRFELDPRKNNENLKDRRYLYAPMEYEGAILPVKFTVKEFKQYGIGKRIYSLEVIAVKIN
jgi:hypothetical protein